MFVSYRNPAYFVGKRGIVSASIRVNSTHMNRNRLYSRENKVIALETLDDS